MKCCNHRSIVELVDGRSASSRCLAALYLLASCAPRLPTVAYGISLGSARSELKRALARQLGGRAPTRWIEPSRSVGSPRGLSRVDVVFEERTQPDGSLLIADAARFVFLDGRLLGLQRDFAAPRRGRGEQTRPSCADLLRRDRLFIAEAVRYWWDAPAPRLRKIAKCAQRALGEPRITALSGEFSPRGELARWFDGSTHLAMGWRAAGAGERWYLVLLDHRLWTEYRRRCREEPVLPACEPGSLRDVFSRPPCWPVDRLLLGY